MSFEPSPEVFTFSPEARPEPIQGISDEHKLFNIFFSNINSFSEKAKNYLFSKHMAHFQTVALVETHRVESQQVIDHFARYHRTAYANPAIKTSDNGSHAGEVIANHSHLNTMPIDQFILDKIAEYSQQPVCFAACYIRLKFLTFLLVVPYLYVGEGISERTHIL